MTPEQQLVKDWMVKFGQDVPAKPTIPSFEIRKLRAKLILEEALETCFALGFDLSKLNFQVDWDDIDDNGCVLSKVMDGVADSMVVNLGCATACGLDAEPFFREVMRSNDSKLWLEEEVSFDCEYEGEDASFVDMSKHYKTELRYEYIGEEFDPLQRQWLVRDLSGKIIKSPSYSKADCESIVINAATTSQGQQCNP